MSKNQQILQIIPATGWYVKWKEKEGAHFEEPVVCWALIEETEVGETYRTIEGIALDGVGFPYVCSEVPNFGGYTLKGGSAT